MPRRRYNLEELQKIAASFGFTYVAAAEAARSLSAEDILRRIEFLEASGKIDDRIIVAAILGGCQSPRVEGTTSR
jgi:hypothetical protein